MISFGRTHDAGLVRSLFARAFPTFETERGAGLYECFAADYDCIVMAWDGVPSGLVMLLRSAEDAAEVHFVMSPEVWGGRALTLGRGALVWIWQQTTYERLVGAIDSENRLALRFVQKLGFSVCGRNNQAGWKRGRLVDFVIVGISRG